MRTRQLDFQNPQQGSTAVVNIIVVVSQRNQNLSKLTELFKCVRSYKRIKFVKYCKTVENIIEEIYYFHKILILFLFLHFDSSKLNLSIKYLMCLILPYHMFEALIILLALISYGILDTSWGQFLSIHNSKSFFLSFIIIYLLVNLALTFRPVASFLHSVPPQFQCVCIYGLYLLFCFLFCKFNSVIFLLYFHVWSVNYTFTIIWVYLYTYFYG